MTCPRSHYREEAVPGLEPQAGYTAHEVSLHHALHGSVGFLNISARDKDDCHCRARESRACLMLSGLQAFPRMAAVTQRP